MQRLYNELILLVKEKTPDSMLPVDMLMQISPMSKEAAYRRLRGEIDFSLEDVMRIARYFDISLDGLFASTTNKNRYPVQMMCVAEAPSAIDRYCQFLAEFIDLLKLLKSQPNPILYVMTDMLIPVFPIYKYDFLSKFYLYKWLYRWDDALNPVKMKDTSISDDIVALHHTFEKEMQDIVIHYICPPELMISHVREVGFLHKMNLLTEEEVQQIKQETGSLLDDLEHDMTRGKTAHDMPFPVFLGYTGFDSTYLYFKNDEFEITATHMFGDGFYYFKDQRIIDKMKLLWDRLLSTSVLVTVSGEKQRFEFMSRQREMLENL